MGSVFLDAMFFAGGRSVPLAMDLVLGYILTSNKPDTWLRWHMAQAVPLLDAQEYYGILDSEKVFWKSTFNKQKLGKVRWEIRKWKKGRKGQGRQLQTSAKESIKGVDFKKEENIRSLMMEAMRFHPVVTTVPYWITSGTSTGQGRWEHEAVCIDRALADPAVFQDPDTFMLNRPGQGSTDDPMISKESASFFYASGVRLYNTRAPLKCSSFFSLTCVLFFIFWWFSWPAMLHMLLSSSAGVIHLQLNCLGRVCLHWWQDWPSILSLLPSKRLEHQHDCGLCSGISCSRALEGGWWQHRFWLLWHPPWI